MAIYTRALAAADVVDLKTGVLNFNTNTALVLSVSGSSKTAVARKALTLTATANIEGRVSFKSNGKSIGGRVGKSTVPLIATCSLKPSVKGPTQLTALLAPTQATTNASANSGTYWIQVLPRTNKRG